MNAIEFCAALIFIGCIGIVGSNDLADRKAEAAHTAETLRDAKAEAERQQRNAHVESRLKQLVAYERIGK